jgi:hypothetical protein
VEVAIVGDRDSLYRTRATDANGVFQAAVDGTYNRFNELAVPFHSMSLTDLLDKSIDAPAHKFYVMLPTLVLSQEQRERLMARFEREHATVLWLYCAGAAYPGQAPSTAANADFLGIATELDTAMRQPEMTLAAEYGVKAIVQPGGSIRDADSIAKANEAGITMLFTGERHFKH